MRRRRGTGPSHAAFRRDAAGAGADAPDPPGEGAPHAAPVRRPRAARRDPGRSLRGLAGGIPGAKWVPPENYHLTLRFIGEIENWRAQEVDDALGVHPRAMPSTCRCAASAPSRRAGASSRCGWGPSATRRSTHLQGKIETALQRIGLAPERRRFAPHVTLARAGPRAAGRRSSPIVQAHNLFRAAAGAGGAFHAVLLPPGQGGVGLHAGGGVRPGVSLDDVAAEARACTLCAAHLPLGPRPVFRVSATARLLIIGQAPGTKVHATGIPWNDPSGDRLRLWLGMTRMHSTTRRPCRHHADGAVLSGAVAEGRGCAAAAGMRAVVA